MSVIITPQKSRDTRNIFDASNVPITSQVPLFYGAYYKIIKPLEKETILDGSSCYKSFVKDEDPEKYCIIYDKLYLGMDTRMKLDMFIFNGHGFMENRQAAEKEFEMKKKSESEKITKFSIPAGDWTKLIDSGYLIKLA